MTYRLGQLVINPKLGLGRILHIKDEYLTVFFKEESENPRTINVAVVPMALAAEQCDPVLDDLALLKKRLKASEHRQRAAKRRKE